MSRSRRDSHQAAQKGQIFGCVIDLVSQLAVCGALERHPTNSAVIVVLVASQVEELPFRDFRA